MKAVSALQKNPADARQKINNTRYTILIVAIENFTCNPCSNLMITLANLSVKGMQTLTSPLS
jgi:hypothetical protein